MLLVVVASGGSYDGHRALSWARKQGLGEGDALLLVFWREMWEEVKTLRITWPGDAQLIFAPISTDNVWMDVERIATAASKWREVVLVPGDGELTAITLFALTSLPHAARARARAWVMLNGFKISVSAYSSALDSRDLEILRALWLQGPAALRELRRRVSMPLSTLHRRLGRLVDLGFVEAEGSGRHKIYLPVGRRAQKLGAYAYHR